jgi:hypothetical protein
MTQHEYMQPRRQDAGAGKVQWLGSRHGLMMPHRLIGGDPTPPDAEDLSFPLLCTAR